MVFQEQPGYFLRAGAALCLSGLGLIGVLRSGLILARLGVEGGKGLEVTVEDSTEE